jgi:hypothetical protein
VQVGLADVESGGELAGLRVQEVVVAAEAWEVEFWPRKAYGPASALELLTRMATGLK